MFPVEGEVPVITVDVTSGESVFTCTARGYRPAVDLLWYKNNDPITPDLTEGPPTANGDTYETSGSVSIPLSTQDDGAMVECRTTGQAVAPSKSGFRTLGKSRCNTYVHVHISRSTSISAPTCTLTYVIITLYYNL